MKRGCRHTYGIAWWILLLPVCTIILFGTMIHAHDDDANNLVLESCDICVHAYSKGNHCALDIMGDTGAIVVFDDIARPFFGPLHLWTERAPPTA